MANKAGQYEYKFEFTTKGTYGFNDKDSIKSTEVKTFELSAVDDGVPAEAIELETPEEQSGEVNLNWNVVGENNIALYEKMAKEHPENPRLAELVNELKELGE